MMQFLKNYKIGVSWRGIVIYAFQLVPNIFWVLIPPANDVLKNNSSPCPILNILEQVFGILVVAILILIMNKNANNGPKSKTFLILSVICIAGYYASWILYYMGIVAAWLMIIGIALMPPLYFLFAGLWQKNRIVVIPCIVFGIIHVGITVGTYLV
jgi:hypothetical protein